MADVPDHHVLQPDHAPTPFTADEIRDATPVGLQVVTETAQPGGIARARTTFVACDGEQAEMVSVGLDDEGHPIGPEERGTARWVDLQAHASFPADVTTITSETIDHPLGRMRCHRYEVRGGTATAVFWFAIDLPGMPIRYGSFVDGEAHGLTDVVERRIV